MWQCVGDHRDYGRIHNPQPLHSSHAQLMISRGTLPMRQVPTNEG
jgi:hypothetical protein